MPAGTFQEFSKNIKGAIETLKGISERAEVESVSEIFLRYISLKTCHFRVSQLVEKKVKMSSLRILERPKTI